VSVVVQTNVSQYQCKRGKVRDVYDIGDKLIIVATDRLSAFDVVLSDPIPAKGSILTKLTRMWLSRLSEFTSPNHFISSDLKDMPAPFQTPDFEGRTMLCWKADKVVPYECIVRGYITGSGWQDYQKTGSVCGISLPTGLANCAKLPQPIFTPSTKAESGHDVNVSFEQMKEQLGSDVALALMDWSLTLYEKAHEYALSRGIIIADTKFEFGMIGGDLLLIDEVLTPDSSRFWPAESYTTGKSQPSLDKQGVRDYLQSLCDAGKWDKQPPAPSLPLGLIDATRNKYLRIYRLLNGEGLQ